ncbi:ORF5 [callitrichine gammaherpesvirus 3]|uniref:DNA polymerase n=8 Tax=Orthoherpesviridae TaxID=3044472 RepID=Q993K6_9GAMA|nr:ORF5 [callitrichine gammaherpesvirus 3]AAK38212.1 ORF5 [callitrichine gammaherpesvirus 3]
MSGRSFFNPFLHCNKTCAKKPDKEYLRLIPDCFKTPGARGVTDIRGPEPPLCFHNGTKIQVMSHGDVGRGMWSKKCSANDGCAYEATDMEFHVYDIIETVYTQEKCAVIPSDKQGYVVPCGIVIKLLGRRREDGASVCINVFGQQGYFYSETPADVNIEVALVEILKGGTFDRRTPCRMAVETVERRSIMGYGNTKRMYHKITLSHPNSISHAATSLKDKYGCKIFEANVDASRRFVLDNKFTTFGWYRCGRAMPRIRDRDSFADFEYDCEVTDLSVIGNDVSWPPYMVMAFDIECLGEEGFPNATNETDLIIQISCVLWSVGEPTSNYRRILLTVGTCAEIDGVEVYEFPSEMDLIYAFFQLIRDLNVEIITGYNVANFDWPYILDRARHIYGINPASLGKIRGGGVCEVRRPNDAGKMFSRACTKIRISGVIPIDMYSVCKEKLSLSDYKLDTVAKRILGTKKEDVHYKEIPHLFRAGPEERKRLGMYCIQDSVLVMDLLNHFVTHVEISEIAKIANIPCRRVLDDGQQIRVFSCLLAAAQKEGFILPMPEPSDRDGYQGATVIQPIAGFYNSPVLVVDFASLYPSIIQAHNLCYSTIVTPGEEGKLRDLRPGEDYESFSLSGGTFHFVKKHIHKSFLASLLESWLAKRKAIRKLLGACNDPRQRTILDKQQLAIKCTCNAVYGFTGVAHGLFPCLTIAETVTLQGRTMLERAKVFVENLSLTDLEKLAPCSATPWSFNPDGILRVIYGDTDSLFIECSGFSEEQVSALSEPLARFTTSSLFNAPISLEAEKIFSCLMLITKKRYVGVLTDGKITMKGVDLVRKTACQFVQTRCRRVLDLILGNDKVKRAASILSLRPYQTSFTEGLPEGFLDVINVLNEAYGDLRANRVPISELSFTTELSRQISAYKSTQMPHLIVYQKILARNEEPPQIHDRIPYVFVASAEGGRSGRGTRKSEMAEDPSYVTRHNIPIAVEHYFEKLLQGTANILQCLFGNNPETALSVLQNFTAGYPHQ